MAVLQYLRLHQGLMLLVTLAAAWLRWWQLPDLPPGFWYDEAYNAMDEPMIHYFGALSMVMFGAKPYTFRLVAVFAGVLTVALMYRWLVTFFADDPDRRWLALIAATGLAFSFWHVAMSRIGFRAILFPFIVILTAYFFWYGLTNRSLIYFVLAGVALGVAQYTYLAARLLPLVFGFFALAALLVTKKQPLPSYTSSPGSKLQPITAGLPRRNIFARVRQRFKGVSAKKAIWIGLLVMIVISFLVFVPLGIFFYYYPTTFSARSGHIFILTNIDDIQDVVRLAEHIGDGLRAFVDGWDQNWRHDLPGRPGLGWLSVAGFWIGLVISVKNIRNPRYLFLLVALTVLWVPALLSDQPVHTLRLSGLLPIFYCLMAVGLITVTRLLAKWLPRRIPAHSLKLAMFALVFLFLGGGTAHDYFARWAKEPMVYQEHNGPLSDLTLYLIDESHEVDILLPFQVYAQPTTRLLLHDEFQEVDVLPINSGERPVLLVTSTPALAERLTRVNSSSYVWLTRAEDGHGLAYVLPQPPADDLAGSIPIDDTVSFQNPYTGETVAHLTPLDGAGPVVEFLTGGSPAYNPVDYRWGQQVRLIGYQVVPDPQNPGQEYSLNLYWQLLDSTDQWDYDITIEILNAQGTPVEETTFSAKQLFRWRKRGVVTSYRSIDLTADTMPGPHSLRVSLSDLNDLPVPLYGSDDQQPVDQVIVGEFYISVPDIDPEAADPND
jgi:4-amino-4-deoxy-L-arabinose transferase-like glycosyltransferase